MLRFRDSLPGTPRHVVGRYGKGLFNYAPHMVDLLIRLVRRRRLRAGAGAGAIR